MQKQASELAPTRVAPSNMPRSKGFKLKRPQSWLLAAARNAYEEVLLGCKTVGTVVKSYPSTALLPAFVLALLLGLGVWGVTEVANRDADSRKTLAASAAQGAAWAFHEQIVQAYGPLLSLTALVHFKPMYADVSAAFASLAPNFMSSVPRNSLKSLQLAPNGVIKFVYPLKGNEGAVNLNLFNVSRERAGVLKTVSDGVLTMVGPLSFLQGGWGVRVRNPIFVADVDEDQTFDGPAGPYQCGSICYNATTRTKFWGFATALVDLESLAHGEDSHLVALSRQGYTYRLTAPPAAPGGNATVVSASEKAPSPSASVQATVPFPNAEWELSVGPGDGSWWPSWYPPILAAVIVVATIISCLQFFMLVSRRQYEILLNSLLPKEVIRDLRSNHSMMNVACTLNNETPASQILAMMADLLEGRQPDMRDILLVRTAIRENYDIYQPLNLGSQIKKANMDSDVAHALLRQLGHTFSQVSSMGALGEEGDGGVDADDDGNARVADENPSYDEDAVVQIGGGGAADGGVDKGALGADCGDFQEQRHERAFDTLQGALALMMSPGGSGAAGQRSFAAAGDGIASIMGDSCMQSAVLPDLLHHDALATIVHMASALAPASLSAPDVLFGDAGQVPLPMVEEVERLLANVDEWNFDAFRLQDATQGHPLSCLGYYLMLRSDLVRRYNLKLPTLARYLRYIEAGYMQDNPYHNAVHAADVLHSLHVMLHHGKLDVHYVDGLGLLAAYMAAIIHDYGHLGLTNDYLIASSAPLALRYNDRSPMENHHCAAAFVALQNQELNFLAGLAHHDMAAVRKQVIEMVMATDMKQHFSLISHFNTVHRLSSMPSAVGASGVVSKQESRTVMPARKPTLDLERGSHSMAGAGPHSNNAAAFATAPRPKDETERLLSLQVALKCADLGHLAAELPVHQKWLLRLEDEFFSQGDKERAAGLPISPLFDRSKQGVSKSQVGFYDFVALPLLRAMAGAFPGVKPMLDNATANYNHWKTVERTATLRK